jgi:hypothetical protein
LYFGINLISISTMVFSFLLKTLTACTASATMSTKAGRAVINARRRKGRKRLAA